MTHVLGLALWTLCLQVCTALADATISHDDSSGIPHRLLFTYKTNMLITKQPTFLYDNVQNTIQKYADAWDVSADEVDVLFMDDELCLELIPQVEPRLVEYFKLEPFGPFKADICRLAALYLYGGYYFDVDIQVLEPLRPNPETDFITASGANNQFFQAVLALSRKHPLARAALESMLNDWYFIPSVVEKLPQAGIDANFSMGEEYIQARAIYLSDSFDMKDETNPMLGPATLRFAYERHRNLTSAWILDEIHNLRKTLYPDLKRKQTGWGCNFIVHDAPTKVPYFYSRCVGTDGCPKPKSSIPTVSKQSSIGNAMNKPTIPILLNENKPTAVVAGSSLDKPVDIFWWKKQKATHPALQTEGMFRKASESPITLVGVLLVCIVVLLWLAVIFRDKFCRPKIKKNRTSRYVCCTIHPLSKRLREQKKTMTLVLGLALWTLCLQMRTALADVPINHDEPIAINNDDSGIPHRLLFTYKTNMLITKQPAFLYDNVQNTIQKYADAWDVSADEVDVLFMDDEMCLELIPQVEPRLVEYFKLEPLGSFKADICRLAALYLYGGYYFDVDIQVVEPLRPNPETDFITASGGNNQFFQAVLALSRKHPLTRATLDSMLNDWYFIPSVIEKFPQARINANFSMGEEYHEARGVYLGDYFSTTHLIKPMLGPATLRMAYDRHRNLTSAWILDEIDNVRGTSYPGLKRYQTGWGCNFIVHDAPTKVPYFYSRCMGTPLCPNRKQRIPTVSKQSSNGNAVKKNKPTIPTLLNENKHSAVATGSLDKPVDIYWWKNQKTAHHALRTREITIVLVGVLLVCILVLMWLAVIFTSAGLRKPTGNKEQKNS